MPSGDCREVQVRAIWQSRPFSKQLGTYTPYSTQKALPPAPSVSIANTLQKRLVARTPLSLRHVDSSLQGFGNVVGIIGIDDQGFFKIFGRSGETRQYQHPGILLVLRRYVFLCDKIHPIPKRRDQTNMAAPKQGGQRISSDGPVDV